MKRRAFVAGLGGAAAWPMVARAQQSGKLPTIGYLGTASRSTANTWIAAFVQRLRELGWIEDRNITIEYRFAGAHSERYAEIAAEFVRLKVDVIFAPTTAGVIAAKQATSIIPIVFATVTDPTGAGLVEGLAQPGGQVTGLSMQSADIAGKRLELLREVVPEARHLAILLSVGSRNSALEMREVQAAARTLGLETVVVEIRQADDVAPALAALKGHTDFLYVVTDPLVNLNRTQINTLALGARLPTMHGLREYVEAGGLISYGPNLSDLYRRAAEYIDKILRGTKPADLPVEQPTKFQLVINLKVAKALGLEIPLTLLARADEVIE